MIVLQKMQRLIVGLLIASVIQVSISQSLYDWPNVLDTRGTPIAAKDPDVSIFSDNGAWHGHSLPAENELFGSFPGPWVHGLGWLSKHLVSPQILQGTKPISLANVTNYPGFLVQEGSAGSLLVESILMFPTSRSSFIMTVIHNSGTTPVQFQIKFSGDVLLQPNTILSTFKDDIIHASGFGNDMSAYVIIDPALKPVPSIANKTYTMNVQDSFTLMPGKDFEFGYAVTVLFNSDDLNNELASVQKVFVNWPQYKTQITDRWSGYLKSLFLPQHTTRQKYLIVKCLETMITNWRSSSPNCKYAGVIPSWYKYNGFWAWDSWKHAAALSLFDINLAKDQIRVMYSKQFQYQQGMIPDVVFTSGEVAWKNTKPPLSGWAIDLIYEKEKNIEWLKEMYDGLVAYHSWWFDHRNHNYDGICQFGASVNSTMNARYESGMDNAVRFDNATMVTNGDNSYSFNRNSVDLNSFLYAEKLILIKFSRLLNQTKEAAKYQQEADELKKQVSSKMYDSTTGYFYDVHFDGTFVQPMGCEGFLPLYAGIATTEQASKVRAALLDPSIFNTKVPFPTISRSAPKFDAEGYWRGPVWLDQTYFALEGLHKYGYHQDAKQLFNQLLYGVSGFGDLSSEPLFEYYNPLTGNAPQRAGKWFGWTASHLLQMLCDPRYL
jgi:putative isomerase